MAKYKILRFYTNKNPEVIKTCLTLKQAKEYCSSHDTSKTGKWFDGYAEE